MTNTTQAQDVFEKLTAEVEDLTREKGWRTDESGSREGHEFAAYIALLHSEASEMLEAYRDKVWSETCTPLVPGSSDRHDHHPGCSGKPHDAPKPVGVGPEAADVFIRLLDMCGIWKIDLLAEVQRVLLYGWSRPYRHGGRQL